MTVGPVTVHRMHLVEVGKDRYKNKNIVSMRTDLLKTNGFILMTRTK